MAARGRQKQSKEVLDGVFAQVRSQFGLEEDLQLVHHEEGRVSIFRLKDGALEAILDRVSGNSFVDMWAGMVRMAPHMGCLPGGVQLVRPGDPRYSTTEDTEE